MVYDYKLDATIHGLAAAYAYGISKNHPFVDGNKREYLCTQLLGIDLRAVKYFERQGCPHLTGAKLPTVDRDRVQACLDAYARWIVNKVANAVFGPIVDHSDKIQ
jgi:hypothetical protein